MPLEPYCRRGRLLVSRISGTLPARISVFSFWREALPLPSVSNSA